MNLETEIAAIEYLLIENPDVTIRDYLEMKITDMGSRKGIPNLGAERRKQIAQMAKTMDVPEICERLGLLPNVVYKACAKEGGSIRAIRDPRLGVPEEKPVKKVASRGVRPPAEYSNHSPWGIAS